MSSDNTPAEYRGPSLRTNAQSLGWQSGGISRSDLGTGRQWRQSDQLYDALNYPSERELGWNVWLSIYRREGQVAGLLSKLVRDTWQGGAPEVADDDPTEGGDEDEDTEFEQAVAQLFDNDADNLDLRAPLLDRLVAADILATLGTHSVVVVGLRDDNDANEPAPDGTLDGFEDLAFVEVFPQSDVEYELNEDINDDRYGRPESYTVGDRNQEIHHTRVVHNPGEDTLVDPYQSVPFFKDIINRICDVQKILGGTSEGVWRGGYAGMVISPPEVIRNANGTTERVPGEFEDGGAALADEIHDYTQNFKRVIRSNGNVETLDTSIRSPSEFMDEQWAAISAAKDIPQSVAKGNETGERSTTEDNASYRSRVAARRNTYTEPRLFRAIVDLLAKVGVLPNPDGDGYDVVHEPLSEKTDKEEADIHKTEMDALSAGSGGNPQALATIPEIRKRLGMDPERGSEAPGDVDEQDDLDAHLIMDRMGLGDEDTAGGTAQGTEAAMGSVDEPSGFANPTERMTTVNARADGGEDVAEDGGQIPDETDEDDT